MPIKLVFKPIESLIKLKGSTKDDRADSVAQQIAWLIDDSTPDQLMSIKVGPTTLAAVSGTFRGGDGQNTFAEFLKSQYMINTPLSLKRLMMAFMRNNGFKSHASTLAHARDTLQRTRLGALTPKQRRSQKGKRSRATAKVTKWGAMSRAQKRSPAGKKLGRSVKAILQKRKSQDRQKRQRYPDMY